jgi:hypothetical protein
LVNIVGGYFYSLAAAAAAAFDLLMDGWMDGFFFWHDSMLTMVNIHAEKKRGISTIRYSIRATTLRVPSSASSDKQFRSFAET